MEPQNNVGGENTQTTQTQESIITPLKKVTPVSKYLALGLFIVLPFVGAWVGYSFGLGKGDVMEHALLEIAVEKEREEFSSTSEKHSLVDERVVATENGKYEIRYVDELELKEAMKSYPNLPSNLKSVFASKLNLDPVILSDAIYFKKVVEINGEIIFESIAFEMDGGRRDLYKLDRNGIFSEMAVTNYNDARNLATWSADRTKIATTDDGLTFGYVDLETDSYVVIDTLEIEGNKRYRNGCELGCEGLIKWIDNNTVSVRIYEFDSCEFRNAINPKTEEEMLTYDCQPFYAERYSDMQYSI